MTTTKVQHDDFMAAFELRVERIRLMEFLRRLVQGSQRCVWCGVLGVVYENLCWHCASYLWYIEGNDGREDQDE